MISSLLITCCLGSSNYLLLLSGRQTGRRTNRQKDRRQEDRQTDRLLVACLFVWVRDYEEGEG